MSASGASAASDFVEPWVDLGDLSLAGPTNSMGGQTNSAGGPTNTNSVAPFQFTSSSPPPAEVVTAVEANLLDF